MCSVLNSPSLTLRALVAGIPARICLTFPRVAGKPDIATLDISRVVCNRPIFSIFGHSFGRLGWGYTVIVGGGGTYRAPGFKGLMCLTCAVKMLLQCMSLLCLVQLFSFPEYGLGAMPP